MPREIVLLIGGLLGAAMVGILVLGGMKIWVTARSSRKAQVGREGLERLLEAMEGLQEQMFDVREAVAELHERIDFTERLLTRGETDASEMRESTPV